MVSILLPTTVPLHGILWHSHSDINRNLIASSELWKLIRFLSINELNTNVVFFCFHLPTINTTLAINNLTHLSYYWHQCNYSVFQSLFCIWFVGHIGVCWTESKFVTLYILPYIYFVFYVLGIFYYVSPLFIVIVTCSI